MYGFTHPGSSCRLAAASARLQIARKKRNFIHSLTTDSGLASTQEKKHGAIYNHFLNHIGTTLLEVVP
jgi:hypothetical protein